MQALGGRFSRYDYANNNPYRFIDPDGRTANAPEATPSPCQTADCRQARKQEEQNRLDAAFGVAVEIYTQTSHRQGVLVGNGGNHLAVPVSDIDMSKWKFAGEITEGNTMSFDSMGGILVQAKSNAWPATAQFGYNVSQRPLAFNGKLAATSAPIPWYTDTFYSSGFTGGKASGGLRFVAYPGARGNRWYVEYPSQASTHDNVFNSVLRIYVPYSH